jgi:hypothetical protein
MSTGTRKNDLNHSAIRAGLASLIFAASPLAVAAAQQIPLEKVAAELGYAYSYLGPEDAVSLTRPGVTVVIRPGERLFDVNDRTEAMDGTAPRFSRSDIYVSGSMVARLRQIAAGYPDRARMTPGIPVALERGLTNESSVTGSITGLSVSQVSGQQEIAVGGKAPANLPITLTLVSTYSTELPDVVISRLQVIAGANGTFETNLSIAPGYFRGSILTLVATSLPGISSAKTRIVMNAPNGTVWIPADQVPRSIR